MPWKQNRHRTHFLLFISWALKNWWRNGIEKFHTKLKNSGFLLAFYLDLFDDKRSEGLKTKVALMKVKDEVGKERPKVLSWKSWELRVFWYDRPWSRVCCNFLHIILYCKNLQQSIILVLQTIQSFLHHLFYYAGQTSRPSFSNLFCRLN